MNTIIPLGTIKYTVNYDGGPDISRLAFFDLENATRVCKEYKKKYKVTSRVVDIESGRTTFVC